MANETDVIANIATEPVNTGERNADIASVEARYDTPKKADDYVKMVFTVYRDQLEATYPLLQFATRMGKALVDRSVQREAPAPMGTELLAVMIRQALRLRGLTDVDGKTPMVVTHQAIADYLFELGLHYDAHSSVINTLLDMIDSLAVTPVCSKDSEQSLQARSEDEQASKKRKSA